MSAVDPLLADTWNRYVLLGRRGVFGYEAWNCASLNLISTIQG